MGYSSETLIASHGMSTASGVYFICNDPSGGTTIIKDLGFRSGDKIERIYDENLKLIECKVNGSKIDLPVEKPIEQKITEMRERNGL